ncbi:MAG: M23 family metallopeptidase [Solirubrobacteraceae bacterium]
MRTLRRAVLAALTSAALLCQAPGALALPGEPGGAVAPASPQIGGSEAGVPASVGRPVLSELHVPSSSIAGRPPRITLELSEQGASTVYLRVLVIDLSSHRTAVTATMGWVHTAHRLSVVWPAGATLAAGTYRVTISAHDRRNGNLLRSARISGEATLTVMAPARPVAPPPAGLEPGVPTPAQTAAEGAVFPVRGPHNFGGPENRFGAPRDGYTHQGQDILTAEGTPDVVPFAGTIEQASYQAGGAGYYVVEHTTYGFDFMFAHCEASSTSVAADQAVTAGQQICLAGQTGDATAPHLHFEMWVGGWRTATGHPIDPLPYLEAWENDGAS